MGHSGQYNMLDWFNKLSVTNKIAIVVPIIIAGIVTFGSSQDNGHIPSNQSNQQHSTINGDGIINGNAVTQNTTINNTTINNALPPEASTLKHSTDKEASTPDKRVAVTKVPVEVAYIKFDEYDNLGESTKRMFQGKTVNWIGKFVGPLIQKNRYDGRVEVNFRPLKNSLANTVVPYKCIVPKSEELFLLELVRDQKIRCIGILNVDGMSVTADKVELVEENN